MNAAGMDVMTGRAVMRMSAVKIWENPVWTFVVMLLILRTVTGFLRQ